MAREQTRPTPAVRVSANSNGGAEAASIRDDEKPRLKELMAQLQHRYARFILEHRLTPDQAYTGTVDLHSLLPRKPGLGRFTLSFAAMKQDIQVQVDRLEAADLSDAKKQTLTGRLITADVDDAGPDAAKEPIG